MCAAETFAEFQGGFKRVNQAGLLISIDDQTVGYQIKRGMIGNEFRRNFNDIRIVQRPVESLAFQAFFNFFRADI